MTRILITHEKSGRYEICRVNGPATPEEFSPEATFLTLGDARRYIALQERFEEGIKEVKRQMREGEGKK